MTADSPVVEVFIFVGLIWWIVYGLATGKTRISYSLITREDQPELFYFTIGLWAVLFLVSVYFFCVQLGWVRNFAE